ncbi:hypothetical protein PG987_016490 [Apiospora arundinis]
MAEPKGQPLSIRDSKPFAAALHKGLHELQGEMSTNFVRDSGLYLRQANLRKLEKPKFGIKPPELHGIGSLSSNMMPMFNNSERKD